MISPVIRTNLSINQGFSTENSGWENMLLGTNPACRDVLSWDRCINLTAAAGIFHLPTLLLLVLLPSTHFNMYVTRWMSGSIRISLCEKSLLFNSLQPHITQERNIMWNRSCNLDLKSHWLTYLLKALVSKLCHVCFLFTECHYSFFKQCWKPFCHWERDCKQILISFASTIQGRLFSFKILKT